MRVLAAVISASLLMACDGNIGEIGGFVSRFERQCSNTREEPGRSTSYACRIYVHRTDECSGERSSVCLVLRDGVPLDQNSVMDAKFAEALAGSDVNVTVYLTDGSHKLLQPPMAAWRKYGLVLPKDELSACAAAACGSRLPKGSMVARSRSHLAQVSWSRVCTGTLLRICRNRLSLLQVCRQIAVAKMVRPNLAVNTDAPSAALRARRGSPVTFVR